MPSPPEIHLEPSAKIHRIWDRWDADVPEVASAVAGSDVQAAAERDGKVREITADAALLSECTPRALGRVGVLVPETDMVVHVVTDCLHPSPARRGVAEQRPRSLRQAVRLAVPTPDQVDENIVGQVLDRMLDRVRCNGIGFTGISNGEVCRDGEAPRWSDKARADVAEAVAIIPGRGRRIEGDQLRCEEIVKARGMHATSGAWAWAGSTR